MPTHHSHFGSFRELAPLELRWLAVEDVDRLYAGCHETDGTIEEPLGVEVKSTLRQSDMKRDDRNS